MSGKFMIFYSICAIVVLLYVCIHVTGNFQSLIQPFQPPVIHSSLSCRLRHNENLQNPCASWLTRADIRASVPSSAPDPDPHLNDVAREYVQLNKDFTTKPDDIEFMPEYRNPCWESIPSVKQDHGKIRCLPHFYLLGFTKSGTTDMWVSMSKHREMAPTMAKEPGWWAAKRIQVRENDRQYPNLKDKMSMDFYLSNYNFSYITTKKQIMGDWSTNGIFSNTVFVKQLKSIRYWEKQPSQDLVDALINYKLLAPHLVYQYTPKAKFIVSMRNPVERIYSAYLDHSDNIGYGHNVSQSDFHKRVMSKIAVVRECLERGNTVRYCAYSPETLGRGNLPYGSSMNQLMSGMYVVFVSDLLKVIPRDQVLFINFATYKKDRMPVLEDIANFLDMDHDPDFAAKIAAAESKAPVHSRVGRQIDIGPMWKKTRDTLTDFYRPFNQQLAEFMDDKQFRFNEPDII